MWGLSFLNTLLKDHLIRSYFPQVIAQININNYLDLDLGYNYLNHPQNFFNFVSHNLFKCFN